MTDEEDMIKIIQKRANVINTLDKIVIIQESATVIVIDKIKNTYSFFVIAYEEKYERLRDALLDTMDFLGIEIPSVRRRKR